MPNLAYTSLLKLVSTYVEPQKAAEVLQRQLVSCKLTADSITANDIKANSIRFTTACGLYIADSAKRDELKAKIAAL